MELKFGDAPSQGAWKNLQIVQVEDADTLWVREYSSKHITKNLSEFRKMEAQMNEKFGKIFFPQPVKTFPVKIGERVLAYYKNHWYRARVMDIGDACKAEVFLLDYGISINVQATAVIPIKDTEWASVSYQAKKVCLFALTPLSLGYALTATGFSVIPRESMVWDPAATNFVKRLVELKPRAEFLPLQAGQDGCTQGLVTLYFGAEACEALPELIEMKWPKNRDSETVVDLAKLLVACEFAKFATEVLIDKMRFNCNKEQDPDSLHRETLVMDAWQEKVTTDSESDIGGECVERELIELMLRKKKYLLPRSRGLVKMVEYGKGDSETTSNIGSSTASLNSSSRSSSRGRGLLNLLGVKCGTSSPLSSENSNITISSVDRHSNMYVKDEFCKQPVKSSIDITNSKLKPHEFTNYCLEEIPAPSSLSSSSSSHQKNILGAITVDKELDMNGSCNLSKTESENLSSILDVNSTDTSVTKINEGKSTYQNCETGDVFCMKLITSDESGVQKEELKIPGSEKLEDKAATLKSQDAIGIQTSKINKKTKPGCKACFKSDSRDIWDREEIGYVEQEFHVSLKDRNTYEGPCIAKLYRIFVAGEIPIALEDVIVDECMLDAILNSHIVKVLNDLQMKATRLQAFAWPVIARGTSAVIIDGKKSGKTLGYIVPIMSTLLDTWQHVSQRLVKGIGAIVIIICKDWRTAKYAGDFLVRFLPSQMAIKVIATWGGCGFEEELKASLQLLGGCDILVTTAPCLVRLLLGEMIDPTYTKEKADTEAFTSLARCCYLVFDDIDLLLENFANEVKQILKWWGEARNKNQRRDFDQQLLLVASSWTKLLNSLIQTLSPLLDPTIIIAEPWEAAVATKACTFVHPVEEGASEHDEIVKLLQENRHGRILVFVQDDEWARKLKILLDSVTLYSLVVLGSTTMWVMQSVVREWHSLSNVILIVCQEATPLLLMHDLSNAELIFHTDSFSSMSTFKMRYAFMVNNFSTDLNKDTLNCESHFMLSKRSVTLLPSLVLELSRSCKIPEDIKIYGTHVLNGCNKYNALCYYLKAYGRCSIGYNCVFRHRIQHTDVESIIPRKGEITFSVVKVMNASRYLIRLLSFKDKAGDSGFIFQDHYLTLFMAIQQHYADPENCKQLVNADTGMQCAVKCKENWARGHIINVDYGKHKPFTVFLIDEGNEMSFGMESIFSLSKRFTLMPPLIVEAYLCRVQPVDFDKEWTFHASKYIDDIFYSTSKSTFIGKIVLSLGTTVWLSPVIELVQTGKSLVKMESLRSKLISNGFGIGNPDHIDSLKSMCREAGISLLSEEVSCEVLKITMEKALKCLRDAKQNSFSVEQSENNIRQEISHVRDFQEEVQVSDNILDICGSEATDTSSEAGEVEGIVTCGQMTNLLLQETLLQDVDVKVGIAEIESPEWFFVQRNDNYEKLMSLESEVDKVTKHWVKEDHEILTERSLRWQENPCITSSSYCLAKFSDGNYYRGWVDKVMMDGMAKVFFVDHGETVNIPITQVQPCPTYLLKALPAQAIPCCLADFSFPSASEKEVKKAMEQVADSVETWTARVLEVVESVDGKMYRVELTDNSVKPPRCMSKELVQSLLLLENEQTSQSACNENFDSEKTIDVSCLGKEEALSFLQSFPNFKELSKLVTSKKQEKRDQDSSVKPTKTKSSELHNEENKAGSELEHQEQAQNDMASDVDYNTSAQIQQEHSRNLGRAKQLKNDSDMFNQMCLLVPPLQAVKDVTCRLYPETLWNQTENIVVVCIQLPGVQHYKCRFASNHLTFMTIMREKFYMIQEKLAGEIDTDSSSLKLRGMSVLIYLAKKSNTMWPTLFAEKGKRAWLKFGYQDSGLDDKKSLLSDDTNGWNDEPWTDMQTEEEMNQRGGFPAGISDSSSESLSDEDVDELIT